MHHREKRRATGLLIARALLMGGGAPQALYRSHLLRPENSNHAGVMDSKVNLSQKGLRQV